MKTNQIEKIVFAALFTALICIATMFFKVSIPLGYAHLGNGFIYLGAVLLGNPWGMFAAGIGSAMADILGGWAQWALPTLIIKLSMGFVVGFIAGKTIKTTSIKTFIAIILGAVLMVCGYTVAGIILDGSVAAGFAQVPGLILENVVGIVLFYLIMYSIEISGLVKIFNKIKN